MNHIIPHHFQFRLLIVAILALAALTFAVTEKKVVSRSGEGEAWIFKYQSDSLKISSSNDAHFMRDSAASKAVSLRSLTSGTAGLGEWPGGHIPELLCLYARAFSGADSASLSFQLQYCKTENTSTCVNFGTPDTVLVTGTTAKYFKVKEEFIPSQHFTWKLATVSATDTTSIQETGAYPCDD